MADSQDRPPSPGSAGAPPNSSTRNWTEETTVLLGFAAALLLLLVIGAVSYRVTTESVKTAALVAHTHEVLTQLENLISLAKDIETDSRGYIITGNERFLEAYKKALPQIDEALATLEHLVRDNREQAGRIPALRRLIQEKIAFNSGAVQLRREQGAGAGARNVATGQGKDLMDEIRRRVTEMESEEKGLLAERTRLADGRANQAKLVILLGSALAVMVVVWALTKITRDLAKRKRAELELDQFFTLSLDLFCIAGFDGYFKRVNAAWEHVLGYPQEELLKRPCLDFVHPDDVAPTRQKAANQARLGELAISFENRYRCADGSYRWFLWNSTPKLEQGVIYAVARDITEQKAVETRIRSLNESLEQRVNELNTVNRELEAFSYSVSHDLRAPLRHVDGFSKILLDEFGGQLPAEAQRLLARVRSGATHMGLLVDDLLNLSRVSRKELNVQVTGLDAVVSGVVAELQAGINGRQVEWRVEQLPFVVCDPALMRAVFTNLISNALKFTRTREPAVIEIGHRTEDGRPVIFVRDNGVGFSMKYADKLFGVFQRLHRAEDFEGTGIGLATVQRVIHKHGGRVWAEAELDRGATFYFTLAGFEPAHIPVSGEQR